MILEIDVGNTRVKWRLVSLDAVVKRGFGMTAALTSVHDVNQCLGVIAASQLKIIRIATVVSFYRELLTSWAAQYSLVPVFAKTSASCSGVLNAYDDIDQMGVDRWLGIVAAYEKVRSACLIVDAGSAVTIDLVESGGNHLGGYIVPGLQMMRHSLFGQTDQVEGNAEKTSATHHAFEFSAGKNTQAAVSNGLPLMLLGLVQRLLLDFQVRYGEFPFVMLTGGDGEFLKDLMSDDGLVGVAFVPELVMDGLSFIVDEKSC